MERFKIVTPKLLRGGAPSLKDLRILKQLWNVNRIVSLDLDIGEKINKECNDLGIEHLVVPIEGDEDLKKTVAWLADNVINLLSNNPVVFVHCVHGRDRTGLAVALYRILAQGWSSNKALDEAKSLQFGQGLDEPWLRLFVKTILEAGKDSNQADVVEQARNEIEFGDITGPTNGTMSVSPICPIQDFVQSYPMHEPTRDANVANDRKRRRTERKKKIKDILLEDLGFVMPSIGITDNVVPTLRGTSPDTIGPMSAWPYTDYHLPT